MNERFYDIVIKLKQSTAQYINLYSKILVWTEDYEKEWFFLYDEIPEEAKYFWANRFGIKTGKLFRYEKTKDGWTLLETGKPLSREAISRIKCGPAFKEVPSVLEPKEYVKWIH